MLPTQILRSGSSEPPVEPVELRAGPLRLLFDNGDLRRLRLGDQEIARRVYVAVRDRNWGTVPAVFRALSVDARPDSFDIRMQVEHRQGAIHFAWSGHFAGSPSGRLSLRMEGAARSTFLRNRIGFCVLLPAGLAGQPCQVEQRDGSLANGRLPEDIDASQPVLPFTAMRRLVVRLPAPGDLRASFVFEGDAFEMEDQRNWTDASFKVYSTPLALPFPVEVAEGTPVSQSVTIDMLAPPGAALPAAPARHAGAALQLSLDDALPAAPLPRIGLGSASHGQPLDAQEVECLRALGLHHLRADLNLADDATHTHLRQAAQQAEALGVGLELAVFVSEGADAELAMLCEALAALRPPLSSLLVYPLHERYQGGSPTAQAVQAARSAGGCLPPGVLFGTGTNSDFIFLKRTQQPVEQVDFLVLAINPQVHAFDDASLIETLEAQAAAVASTRRLAQGKPVHVSPVTLKPRFNPYATSDASASGSADGELPPQVDPRQVSLFAAGWTLGSLRAMLLGGAASVTYYETTGWRGVMETRGGSPSPAFPPVAGAVFPLYHVLAALAGFAPTAGESTPAGTGQPLACARPDLASAVLLRRGARARLLVASHSPRPLPLCITGLPPVLRARLLDETTAGAAMRDPRGFWPQSPSIHPTPDGRYCATLLPYAVAILDL